MKKEWSKFFSIAALDHLEVLHARFYRHAYARHYHEAYALGVILDGSESYYYNHRNHVADTGNVITVNPGEVHTGYASDITRGWCYFMFYPTPELIAATMAKLGYPMNRLPLFPDSVITDPDLARKIRRFKAALDVKNSDLAREALFLEIMARYLEKHADFPLHPSEGRREPEKIRHVRRQIEQQFAENLSLAALAGEVSMSPYALLRQYKKETGVTPYLHQAGLRIRRAKALLAQSVPPAMAAHCSGFSDQSHLNRQFKKWVGVTPGHYSRQSAEQAMGFGDGVNLAGRDPGVHGKPGPVGHHIHDFTDNPGMGLDVHLPSHRD